MPFMCINITGSGDNEIIAAQPDRPILVYGYDITCKEGGVTSTWKSGASTLLGIIYSTVVSGGGLVRQATREPIFSTAVGQALNLNTDANGHVGGSIQYGF